MHRFKTWQLFAICVLVWGTTWHAITYQLSDFAAEFGVALRFALAGGSVLAFCPLARRAGSPSRSPTTARSRCRASSSTACRYVCVYHAERFVPSGLVAVGYSASPLLAGIGAAVLFGVAARPAASSSAACSGWPASRSSSGPEIARASGGERAALGALLTVASVLLSADRQPGREPQPHARRAAAAGDGLRHALRRDRRRDRRPRPRPQRRLADGAELVALAGLPRASPARCSTFACFLTLQDRVGVGAGGHRRRDDAAARAARLDRLRRLSPRRC